MDNYTNIQGTMIELKPPLRLLHILQRPLNFTLPTHKHDFYHIIFVTEGAIKILYENNTYHVNKNQAAILPPEIPHAITSDSGYSQISVDISNNHSKSSICTLLKQIYPDNIYIRDVNLPPRTYEKYVTEARDLNPINIMRLQNRAESLTLTFLETSYLRQNNSFKEDFLDMVTQDHATLTLPDMCAHLNISKTHLERLINKEFGCGAIEYYNLLKSRRACFLLQNSNMPIKEISNSLGFYDMSHFNRFFKKHNNTTPMAFRNNGLSQNK